MTFAQYDPPSDGSSITIDGESLVVPDDPIIPFIEGDGSGRDIWRATKMVLDTAVEKTYGGAKRLAWYEVFAGEKAKERFDSWLPEDTFEAIRTYVVALKGPLTTPVGEGIRSLNVTLRQVLDLYACVRPVEYIEGVPSPVRRPEQMNVVIYRENTEDVYAGIEWEEGSAEAKKLIAYIKEEFGKDIRPDSGIGIKPISITGTRRLVKKAIRHAIDRGRSSVTLVHKGNIMKFTEGAFMKWGYALAAEEFPEETLSEADLWDQHDGKAPDGKIVVKDRLADSMFQQILTRTSEYDVLAMPNLNGDYLSDACAAQVGGLGMAPGANIGDHLGLFEATHGTAPKYADKNVINPGSLILSGAMMLAYLGWEEAAAVTRRALRETIEQKTVTYDLERQMEGATKVSTSQYAANICKNMG